MDLILLECLTLLKNIALSDAYTTELALLVGGLNSSSRSFNIIDADGNPITVSAVVDMSPEVPTINVGQASISPYKKPVPPYPYVGIWGHNGPLIQSTLGHELIPDQYENDQLLGNTYDLSFSAYTSYSANATFESIMPLVMCEAFSRIIQRNRTLGGAVRSIFPLGSPTQVGQLPAGDKAGTELQVAVVEFHAQAFVQ